MHRLILRRRIPLVDVHKALLTRLADNCIGFNCDPGSMIPNAALANKEIWAVDDSVRTHTVPVSDVVMGVVLLVFMLGKSVSRDG